MKKTEEFTLAVIKPDACRNGVAALIVSRLASQGLRVERLFVSRWTPKLAAFFYLEHKGKPFYKKLVRFMSSGDSITMLLTGPNAIKRVRKLIGPTLNPPAGTIRGEFGNPKISYENAIHASDSVGSAVKEISILFILPEVEKGLFRKDSPKKRRTTKGKNAA